MFVLLFLENEVEKSEISDDDADSIQTDEDEDLPKSDSTDGKSMAATMYYSTA